MRTRSRLLLAAAVAVLCTGAASPAQAAQDPQFPRWTIGDPNLRPPPPRTLPPEASHGTLARQSSAVGGAPEARAAARARGAADPTSEAVTAALEAGLIDDAAAARYRGILASARATLRRLGGRRKRELGYVLGTARRTAARGELYSHRLPAGFEIIRRNREWWGTRGAPPAGRRVRFPRSRVIWQYYPGRGMQLQPLANFGRANGYWQKQTPDDDQGLRELLDEMLALGSQRAGGLAWEYWFDFGGGRPPWTSGISQGTAIQALVRGAERLGRPDLLRAAESALGVFRAATPVGVQVRLGGEGSWYALYSFSPGLRVLNAHAQALNGLFDLAASASPVAIEARTIYTSGLRGLTSRIRLFDTGSWSKYAHPGARATLQYHRLNRDVLRSLCERSREPRVCGAVKRFTRYLRQRGR